MLTKTESKGDPGFSHIRTLDDLKNEIQEMKAGIHSQETEIKQHLKNLPQEVVYAGLRPAVHFLTRNGVPVKTFELLRSGIGLFLSVKKQQSGIKRLASDMKEIVVYTLVSKLVGKYLAKRKSRQKVIAQRVNT